MKIVPVILRSMSNGLLHRSQMLCSTRMLSAGANLGNDTGGIRDSDSFESRNEFEQRTFSGTFQGSSKNEAFFQRIDKLDTARSGFGSQSYGQGKTLDFTTFSDGMDGRLERAAEDLGHELGDDYSFRDDVILNEDMAWTTYEPKDLDLRQPAPQPYVARKEFTVTTKEVLSRADFRNVRFLANFITEAGIIIKRSQTGISAKAQRKVAREIKTARAFGLMPFTTMGTKSFVYGKSMEDHNEDFVFQNYYWNTDNAPRNKNPFQ